MAGTKCDQTGTRSNPPRPDSIIGFVKLTTSPSAPLVSTLCHTIPCHTIPYHTIPHHAIPYHTVYAPCIRLTAIISRTHKFSPAGDANPLKTNSRRPLLSFYPINQRVTNVRIIFTQGVKVLISGLRNKRGANFIIWKTHFLVSSKQPALWVQDYLIVLGGLVEDEEDVPEQVVVGRRQPLHQAFDRVNVLLRLVAVGSLCPRRVVLWEEHAVWQRSEQVLQEGGSDEDRDLGPVDLLPLVQPLPQVSHHPDVWPAPEDPNGFWTFLLELDEHGSDCGRKFRSSVSPAQLGKGATKQPTNLNIEYWTKIFFMFLKIEVTDLLFFLVSVNGVWGSSRYLTDSTEHVLKLHAALHLHFPQLTHHSQSTQFRKITFFNFFFWLPTPSPEKLETCPTRRRMNEHLGGNPFNLQAMEIYFKIFSCICICI